MQRTQYCQRRSDLAIQIFLGRPSLIHHYRTCSATNRNYKSTEGSLASYYDAIDYFLKLYMTGTIIATVNSDRRTFN